MARRWTSEDTAKEFVKELHERKFTVEDIDSICVVAIENGWIEAEDGEKIEGWFEELEQNDGEYLPEKEGEE